MKSVGVHVILEYLDEKEQRTGKFTYYPKSLFEKSHRDFHTKQGFIWQAVPPLFDHNVKCIEVGERTITIEDTFYEQR